MNSATSRAPCRPAATSPKGNSRGEDMPRSKRPESPASPPNRPKKRGLTSREREELRKRILELRAQNKSGSQIAQELGRARITVQRIEGKKFPSEQAFPEPPAHLADPYLHAKKIPDRAERELERKARLKHAKKFIDKLSEGIGDIQMGKVGTWQADTLDAFIQCSEAPEALLPEYRAYVVTTLKSNHGWLVPPIPRWEDWF